MSIPVSEPSVVGKSDAVTSPLLTMDEVATFLSTSSRYVRELVDAGEIAFIDIGTGRKRRVLRFRPEYIDEFLIRRHSPARAATSTSLSADRAYDRLVAHAVAHANRSKRRAGLKVG